MTAAIETAGLTKRFGPRVAVDRLDLTVPAGSIFALLGDNGAGKTTTIRLLTGQFPPDAGSARVLGHDAWADAVPLRHRVGYVPEKPRLYDWMTADEIGWFVAGFHRPGFRDRYRNALERFGVDPSAKLANLSKGGYAKVGLALALALAPDPEVLILDEPTSGLDLMVRREFLASMIDLSASGRTILISSHQIAELERVASHAAFLSGGRLLLAAPLEDLRKRVVRVRLHYTGEPPDPDRLGTVLDRESLGRQWQATLLDPDPAEIEGLSHAPGLSEVEVIRMSLEETYAALLARPAAAWAGR
jgi:ABC-2 type transport system ATP-binding protein